MKVLFISGADTPGGAKVQREMTINGLRDLGVEVAISTALPESDEFDLVHSFDGNLTLLRKLRSYGRPIVLSTIYWSVVPRPLPEDWLGRFKHVKQALRVMLQFSNAAITGRHEEYCRTVAWPRATQAASFESVDLLLPNSESEGRAIHTELGVTTPYHVVPNAADESIFTLHGDSVRPKRDLVTYSGRIEPRKNQLGLIRALRGTGVPLRIVGPIHHDHGDYAEQCRKALDPSMEILPSRSHEDLVKLYRSTKVHVLPSYGESTGLSSLEAALCGANIVTTHRYFTRDYFEDLAWYCDYQSSKSIRNSVLAAYQAEWKPDLRNKILQHYTWKQTAEATLAAYNRLLSAKNSKSSVSTLIK